MWPVFKQERYGRVFTIIGQKENQPQAASEEGGHAVEVAMGEESAQTEDQSLREVEDPLDKEEVIVV